MNTISLLKELRGYAVFDNSIVSAIVGKTTPYVNLILYRLKNRKYIIELERDLYTVQDDPLVIASQSVWPCYISFWTALRHHNLTEQLPQSIYVITTRQKKNKINFQGKEIKFIVVKPAFFFGYKKERIGKFDIFIAEPEKAIIDSILFNKISTSEIFEILRNNKEDLDFDKLMHYALKINKNSLIKRIGYMCDFIGKDYIEGFEYSYKKSQTPLKQTTFAGLSAKLKEKNTLNLCENKAYSKSSIKETSLDNKYVVLDLKSPAQGRKNKKWKVIENVRI